ncbi:hypothetical protein [Bradyrhizobium elkanii]|uniref:hypothetical protein n=1 Tax=Bradyrhizobium elkanii TaxID=29448 RepID=UPI003D1BC3C8
MVGDGSDFKWGEARNEGLVVVPEQAAIAVYENPNGDVVIRQEAQMHPDEDHYVYIQHLYLPVLIAALEQLRLKKQRESSG